MIIKNKRGQSATDLAIIVIVIFFIAFLGLIFAKIFDGINGGFQASNIDATSKASFATSTSNFISGWDIAIVVALGFAYMGLFFTTREIPVNPMYFFINLFFIVLALLFGAIMSNAFDMTNTADFVTERAAMPATVFIMGHLLEFAVLAAVIIMIGLFAKPSGAQ